MMQDKFKLLGAALILFGVLLLVHRIGYLPLHWHEIAWGVLTLIGAAKVVRGFSRRAPVTVFWGMAYFLAGSVGVVHHIYALAFTPLSGASIVVLILAISFLAAFLTNTGQWHIDIPTLFFLSLGTLLVASDFDYVSRWDILETFSTYWPLALVLFGVALLLNRRPA